MTETNKEEEKKVVIAEALIQTATQLATSQDMKLVELIGHMEIAKQEVFNRNVKALEAHAAAQAASQSNEQVADADTPGQVVAFQDEGEDKAEK